MKTETKIIHLIGFPGTGKYTIAKELCRQDESLVLIDNHAINNVLFSTMDLSKRLPVEIFGYINEIYDVLFKTMSTISRKDKSFIFTNTLTNEDDFDRIFLNKIIEMSERRNSVYIPIRLVCGRKELHRRLVTPERKKKMKLTDTVMLDSFISGKNVILTKHENEFTLDVGSLSVKTSVSKIENYVKNEKGQ